MTAAQKAAQAVSRLLRRTKERDVQWQRVQQLESLARPKRAGDLAEQSDDKIEACYEATVDGRRLAIFEARREGEMFGWTKYVQLVLLDDDGNVQWRFPGVEGLESLMDAVRYESGNVETFLDSL